MDEVTIDGVIYVQKSESMSILDGLEYCMVRTYSAGVFAGYVEERNGREVTLRNARRIWKWSGAATLSQLATQGTSDPTNCKFPVEVSKVILTEAIEIIPLTIRAKKTIDEVPRWTV